MAGIRNWTVITQRVRDKQDGLVRYSNYLLNDGHPNHKKSSTEIKPMHGDYKNFAKYATVQALEFDMANKKGGRKVASYAQSFVFVLPETVEKPTPEQWKAISADLIRATHKALIPDVPVNSFGNRCFSNLHDQNNPHLNLLVPRIFEGKRLEELDRKGLLLTLKKEFNLSALKHCKIDHKKYTPTQKNVGRRKSKWQVEQEQIYKERERLTAENLSLSRLALEVTQTREQSEEIKRKAEVERIAAEKAKAELEQARADAEQAKADAERTIGLIAEITRLYNSFKESLTGWVRHVRNYDHVATGQAQNEVIKQALKVQNHDKYDDSMEWVLFTEIEMAEADIEPFLIDEKPISSKVRRRRTSPKYTP